MSTLVWNTEGSFIDDEDDFEDEDEFDDNDFEELDLEEDDMYEDDELTDEERADVLPDPADYLDDEDDLTENDSDTEYRRAVANSLGDVNAPLPDATIDWQAEAKSRNRKRCSRTTDDDLDDPLLGPDLL